MQKFIVGLTGPTGSGKSTIQKLALALGFFCIDADKVARKATEKGSPLLPKLQKEFGDILNPDGSLNRAALAEVAFKDIDSTNRLNSITLPYILKDIENIIKKAPNRFILLDAPTLFEAGAQKICSTTVGVIADEEIRIKRIIERDGISEEAALLRINAGKPESFYLDNCNYVLTNNGSVDEFLEDANALLNKFISEAV